MHFLSSLTIIICKFIQVEATFKRFDKNSDGVLQKEEVKLTFEELNIPVSPADIQAIFDLFDKDKNGTIDYTEFIDVLCEMQSRCT